MLAKQALGILLETHFAPVILERRSLELFAWAGLNHDPPDLSLPSRWIIGKSH
jgi:hypothetical protein